MTLWPGRCMVHDAFTVENVTRVLDQYPGAILIAHPECPAEVLAMADFVGSTTKLIDRVRQDTSATYVLATESGIIHAIRKDVPGAKVIPLPPARSNVLGSETFATIPAAGPTPAGGRVLPAQPEHGCACAVCPHMKRNTMEKLYLCLLDLRPQVDVPEPIRVKALRSVQRMLEISA
jgi:quinolinate synthase